MYCVGKILSFIVELVVSIVTTRLQRANITFILWLNLSRGIMAQAPSSLLQT